MISKFFFKPIVYSGLLIILLNSCRKDDKFTPINMNDLNPDVPYNANTELDQWLKANLLDVYNSEVIYRYSRYHHEYDRNITPIDVDRVQPFMETVIGGFANPYVSVAGMPFMKVNMPKQWVLYGSSSYSSTTVYWGSAVGGVRVNIFDLNNFSKSNTSLVRDRLGTIHHEFTHILNQRVIIPAEFREISKSEYTGDWQNMTDAQAQNLGFMRAYSAQNPMEDFADMVKYPVVWGPSWFENLIRTRTSAAGAAALRAKEQSVLQYFNSGLQIDFRELQKKVQLYLKDTIKDPEVTFPYWINQGLYRTVTIAPDDQMYQDYGSSDVFNTVYNNMKTYMAGLGRTLLNMQLRFNTPTSLTVRLNYLSGTSAFAADYDFAFATNANTGITTFTKVAQSGTTGSYSNAQIFVSGFETTIQAYLTSGTFIADWIPLSAPASVYAKIAGFTKSGEPGNYFYGTLGQTL